MTTSKCLESTLVYGVSGSGKTTQVQELALWVENKTGKKTRLVSASGGGWTSILPAVEAGLVIPTYIRGRSFPVETLNKMTQGWWPEDPNDPTSRLIPPEKQPDWNDIGGYAFDSMTECCEWMMSYLTNAEAAGDFKISSQPMKFKDGDTFFGSPSMAHYGNIQTRISDFVTNSKGLRGMYVLWTALELKATDDNTRLPLYGPDVSGRAKTAIAPAWFDNTLHLYITGQGGLKKGKATRKLFLTTHFEDDQIPFVAKNRGHFSKPLPEFLEGENCSLFKFMQLLEKSQKEASEQFKNRIKGE